MSFDVSGPMQATPGARRGGGAAGLAVDFHVHSTFSDGRGTVAENVAAAERAGLHHLCCVDHVRRATDWVPAFSAEVRRVAERTDVALTAGVETKILDNTGQLDLPDVLPGIDHIFAADHQVPTPAGPASPKAMAHLIATRQLHPSDVIRWILDGTMGAMRRHPGLVLAHLFSILPKLGLDPIHVPDASVARLAAVAREEGAVLEVSERWRCPDPRTVRAFVEAGVPIVASTDSHQPETIGRYDYVARVFNSLHVRAA